MSCPFVIRFLCVFAAGTVMLVAQKAAPPKAVPVEDDLPVPKAVPVKPGTVSPDAPPKATGPDEDLFDYATLVYERQEYGLAAQSLAKYLQNYPGGRHVPLALFR